MDSTEQKVAEAELSQAVQKTKGNNQNKGKGKNKNKNRVNKEERKPIVKKSVLNIEYPYELVSDAQSPPEDKVNMRQETGPSGDAASQAEEEALLTGLLREWNSLPMNEDVELPSMLQPKLFSSFYNTPDLFRIGVEVSTF